jgi:hypothetical protein
LVRGNDIARSSCDCRAKIGANKSPSAIFARAGRAKGFPFNATARCYMGVDAAYKIAPLIETDVMNSSRIDQNTENAVRRFLPRIADRYDMAGARDGN